jgi:hypothetical protein
MGFLSNILSFEKVNIGGILGKLADNPERALIGAIDPFSSKVWSGVTGKDYQPLVDQWGGATPDTYAKAKALGIDTSSSRTMQDLATAIAAYEAGSYGAGQLGMGGAGGAAGSGAGAGATPAAAGSAPSAFGSSGVLNAGSIGKYVAAGLPLVSSAIQAQSSKNALDQIRQASNQADATQRYFYDTSRADSMPFLLTGYGANDQINSDLANGAFKTPTFDQYQKDPSYDWQQKEALRLGQNTAAARNGLYRGSTASALQDRAQNIANSDYTNWFNRTQGAQANRVNMLNAVRTGGQAAANTITSTGTNAANQIGANQAAYGDAAGANALVQGNLLGGAINRLSSYFGGSGNGSASPNTPKTKFLWDSNSYDNGNGFA